MLEVADDELYWLTSRWFRTDVYWRFSCQLFGASFTLITLYLSDSRSGETRRSYELIQCRLLFISNAIHCNPQQFIEFEFRCIFLHKCSIYEGTWRSSVFWMQYIKSYMKKEYKLSHNHAGVKEMGLKRFGKVLFLCIDSCSNLIGHQFHIK